MSRHRLVSVFLEQSTSTFKDEYVLRECSLRSLFSENEQTHSFDLQNPVDGFNDLMLVGSCNGLICILVNLKQFLLWNPSTKESKQLADHEEQGVVTKYGFGFDGGDYRVYATFQTDNDEGIGKTFSLKDNSWGKGWVFKDFDNFDFDMATFDGGKRVGERLHWSKKRQINHKWEILYLDFKEERTGFLDQPVGVESGFYATIGVFDGLLSMACDYRPGSHHDSRIDIWLRNTDGVENAWSKWISVPYGCVPWTVARLSTPMCMLDGDAILFTDSWSLVI